MIEELLSPLASHICDTKNYHPQQWGALIEKNEGVLPERNEVKAAIIGIAEGRGAANNSDTKHAPALIRQELYKLYADAPMKVIDLGDLQPGASLQDTNSAVAMIVHDLLQDNIVPILLGGSQALTLGQFKAYERMEKFVNIAVVDSHINFNEEAELSSENYLAHIINHQPNYLFNFSHLAHQTYLTQPDLLTAMKELSFECQRLGEVQNDIKEVEPTLRNSDMLSFDMKAVRMSDAPAHIDGSPHGLYGEQACTIARYAGISNQLSSFGLFELNPAYDNNRQSTKLAAHIVWHFLQGLAKRKNEHPEQHPKNFLKYMVTLQANEYEIIFWKSKTNGRWWMELPIFDNKKYLEKRFLPCSENDYLIACRDEIPPRWLNGIHRMD